MTLNSTRLANAIKSALDSQFGAAVHTNGATDRQNLCNLLAAAIVSELTSNGLVITNCPAGAGTGTIT